MPFANPKFDVKAALKSLVRRSHFASVEIIDGKLHKKLENKLSLTELSSAYIYTSIDVLIRKGLDPNEIREIHRTLVEAAIDQRMGDLEQAIDQTEKPLH